MPRKNRPRATKAPARPACEHKIRYRNRIAAEKAVSDKRRLYPDTPELGVYACVNCGGWHLTSQLH